MHQKRLLDGLNVLEGIALYSEVLVQHIGGGGHCAEGGKDWGRGPVQGLPTPGQN